ncbi:uncharacterized protein LOC127286165 [Leptopilina boulardi]|uniref:uncharacterized protein LOC127286165 n=1 Tax=Leptopilina boulardi TaxID=63433 RepID=UPI0021F50D4F|nr:uncharacterized protein LOC127286165 [Leptopilina boulardi]
MEFASPLQTIEMISAYTYLTRISRYLIVNGNFNSYRNNAFAAINAFNTFIDYPSDYDGDQMDLTREIIRGSDLYGEKNNEQLDQKYLDLMFDYIVYTVVFENKYGNIYGFLADIVRKKETLNIKKILKNAKNILTNLTNNRNEPIKLDSNVIHKIYHGSIVPLFPKTNRNLNLKSMDFIYAQAGWSIYNSDLIMNKTEFFFSLNKIKSSNDNYVFDDCVEIAIAIEQLVIMGKINKKAMKIFALPALLLYVYIKRDNLKLLEMNEIVNSEEHWTMAYELLYQHLRDTMDYLKKAFESDSKYQYYLAVHDYQDEKVLAAREILMNCKLNINLLENEVYRYLNNSENYTCLNDTGKLLKNVGKIYEQQVTKLLVSYNLFIREMMYEDYDLKKKNNNNETNGNNYRLRSNGKIFQFCNESMTTIFEIDFFNTLPLSRDGLEKLKKLYNEERAKKENCLSSFLPCFAGIMEGNPIDTSINCPINGTIRSQIIENTEIFNQFTTFDTRLALIEYGTSLRTIALKKSMLTALSRENFIWNREINLYFDNFTNIGNFEFPVIDRGYEIINFLTNRDYKTINDLINNVEENFFISYQSTSRNFNLNNIQIIENLSDKIDTIIDYDICLKRFYGKINNYYGYSFIKMKNNKIAELRFVGQSMKKEFVQFVGLAENNQKIYKIVDLVSQKLTGPEYYLTNSGLLSRR